MYIYVVRMNENVLTLMKWDIAHGLSKILTCM